MVNIERAEQQIGKRNEQGSRLRQLEDAKAAAAAKAQYAKSAEKECERQVRSQ